MIMIRKADLEDIPQIRAVGSASWRATYAGIFPDKFIENALEQWWSDAGFQRSIPNAAVCNLVAEQDGQIIGMLMGTVDPREEGQVHLFKLYIHPDHVGQGIGKQLWQAYLQNLAAGVKRVDLEVEPQNARAIQFYTRLGLQETGINEIEAFGYTMKTMGMSLNLQAGQGDKPSDAVVRAILDVVAPESVDFVTHALAGSYSNHTHLVEIQSPTPRRIVLRRYNVENGNVVGKARCEFHALKLLQNHDVPAPKPLLLDDEGRLFGSPGIVTEYVAGTQISAADNPVEWAGKAETVARILAKIHAIPYDGTPFLSNGNVEVAWFLKSGAVPDYMMAYPEGESVWHTIHDALPHIQKVKPRLTHIDFWSGNILWDKGEISAVVDWEEASYGDPALDVAYCRMEYYLEGMDDEAEKFLRVYEEAAGEKVANLGIWELAASVRPMLSLDSWLTRPHMDERFARFIANAKHRLSIGE